GRGRVRAEVPRPQPGARHRRSLEEVRRARGIGLDGVAPPAIPLSPRYAKAPDPVALAADTEVRHDLQREIDVRRRYQLAFDLDLDASRGVRRGQQQGADVLARDVATHLCPAPGNAVCVHHHRWTAVLVPGTRG